MCKFYFMRVHRSRYIITIKNYCCPVKKSHADYAKFANTMQRIYPLSINDFAETYIASLVCCHPDGKAQAPACGQDAEGVSAQ